MDQGDGHVGDLLHAGRLDDAERLRRQRAAVRRLIDELEGAFALVPSDAGTFWRSDAHRAYAARLQDLRRMLARARTSLHDALSSIDAAVAELGQ
jgi:hypothetical protein